MHFAKSGLDAEIFFCSVGMWSHNSDDRGITRIISRSNNSKNNILTREDTSNSFMVHDQNSSRMIILHQSGSLTDCCADIDKDGWGSCFEDGREIWTGHLLTEVREILEHLLWLGSCGAPFTLNTLQCVVQFLG